MKYYIIREDLWNKETFETEGFENEIDEIFKVDISIAQTLKLYDYLEGDTILEDKKHKNKDKNKEKEETHMDNKHNQKEENMINTDTNQVTEGGEVEYRDDTDKVNNVSDNEHSEESEEEEEEHDDRDNEI